MCPAPHPATEPGTELTDTSEWCDQRFSGPEISLTALAPGPAVVPPSVHG
jgi:hypothetical protein